MAVALGLAPKKVAGKNEKQQLLPDPPKERSTGEARDDEAILLAIGLAVLGLLMRRAVGTTQPRPVPVTVKVMVSPTTP